MKIAYFDCFSGASGDMILGALVDAGLSLEQLQGELARLPLSGYALTARPVVKRGLAGAQVVITLAEEPQGHPHRRLADIKGLIGASSLPEAVKARSIEIFTRLAAAEARVHRIGLEEVHFHEVGAVDAILDVVGAVSGLQTLGIEKIYCSPLHLGSGTVTCAHGVLPVPAPAVLELVQGRPVYATGVQGELLTPTGAAILTTLASEFGPLPPMTVTAVGCGAGSLDPPLPNLLRLCIGETPGGAADFHTEQVAVLETNIDDMNPQLYDYLIQKMLSLGALEVFLTPAQMKKNRPGTLLSLICAPAAVEKFAAFLLEETTTIGLRWRLEQRLKAARTIREAPTRYGPVRFKVAQLGDRVVQVSPEYEDCKRLALEQGAPLREVMEEARAVALALKRGAE